MTTTEKQVAEAELERLAWWAPVAYTSDQQFIVEALRGRAAQLLLEHPDEMEEPYPGAGYCTCKTCQVDVPLLDDAAAIIEAARKEGGENG